MMMDLTAPDSSAPRTPARAGGGSGPPSGGRRTGPTARGTDRVDGAATSSVLEHPSADRVGSLDETIFDEMSALAVAHDAINLGQGFPDVDGPDSIIDAAVDALRSGRHNQYAPGTGIGPLRTAIARHQRRFHDQSLDPDTQVLVTTGATEAIAAALLALVDPGDEVITLDPAYDSYTAGIALAGATRIPVILPPPDFAFDPDRLDAAITPATKLLLLNSPHNPTGTVLSHHDLTAIADIAIDHDLLVVTDEVYEHLVYDHHAHIPIATLPGMADRTLTISSAGKTFAMTGWKIGWALGPEPLVAATRAVKQFLTYSSGAPLQPAIARALDLPDHYYTDLAATMQTRRDLLADGLADLGMTPTIPGGGYFITTDVRPLGFDDGLEFCRMLPERVGVAAIPHQVFWHDPDHGRHLVRWSFAKRAEVLEAGLDRLAVLAG